MAPGTWGTLPLHRRGPSPPRPPLCEIEPSRGPGGGGTWLIFECFPTSSLRKVGAAVRVRAVWPNPPSSCRGHWGIPWGHVASAGLPVLRTMLDSSWSPRAPVLSQCLLSQYLLCARKCAKRWDCHKTKRKWGRGVEREGRWRYTRCPCWSTDCHLRKEIGGHSRGIRSPPPHWHWCKCLNTQKQKQGCLLMSFSA